MLFLMHGIVLAGVLTASVFDYVTDVKLTRTSQTAVT